MNQQEEQTRIERGVEAVRRALPAASPEVAVVLGSGLGGFAETLEDAQFLEYSAVPGFPQATVKGHAGRLATGRIRGRSIVAMQGRVHLYEGYTPWQVTFPVRLMLRLGAKTLVVTNAAGGINPSFPVGSLMLITDHLNLTGTSSLLGPNIEALGPRFPDLSEAYDADLRRIALAGAEQHSVELQQGVYAGVLGPAYETPAEIRMLRTLGADAVGMSTVLEVIAAKHMGAKVFGLSCITNLAAGLSKTPLGHEEVFAAAEGAKDALSTMIRHLVSEIP